jgi:hypothetical protein
MAFRRLFPIRRRLRAPFTFDSGHCYTAPVPDLVELGDDSGNPARSPLILYEDGTVLGEPHSAHDDIRAQGCGLFSHWDQTVYFSSSDNSDPNTNGRKYVLRARREARPPRRIAVPWGARSVSMTELAHTEPATSGNQRQVVSFEDYDAIYNDGRSRTVVFSSAQFRGGDEGMMVSITVSVDDGNVLGLLSDIRRNGGVGTMLEDGRFVFLPWPCAYVEVRELHSERIAAPERLLETTSSDPSKAHPLVEANTSMSGSDPTPDRRPVPRREEGG